MLQEASRCEHRNLVTILIDAGAALQNIIGRIAAASCICKDCDGPEKPWRQIVVEFQMHASR
jgi:hypothetical protein